jgi:hypothetical protein
MISSTNTVPVGVITIPDWTTPHVVNAEPALIIKEGRVQLGDDFTITVEELITCLKHLHSLTIKEHQEEFI